VFCLPLQLLFKTFVVLYKHLASYTEHTCNNACRSSCKVVIKKKSTLIWDITSCSPLKTSWHFRGTCCLLPHSRRISQARNQHESGCQAELRLGGIISQKIVLSITTAVRTSNPTLSLKISNAMKVGTTFVKLSNVRYHTKPSNSARLVLCVHTGIWAEWT
jgi:hypothetical protein